MLLYTAINLRKISYCCSSFPCFFNEINTHFFFIPPFLLLKNAHYHSFASPVTTNYRYNSKNFDYPSSKSNFSINPSCSLSPADYASLLKSCISQRAIEPGKQIHAQICLSGLALNVGLATKLVDLYCNCNALVYAHQLFDKMPKSNLFLWNVLIRGYAWDGPYQVAISLYYQLLDHGLNPDNFTFPFVLKACSALLAVKEGREIHEHVIRTGWENDVFVGAALIDMYAKCGCLESARGVFDKIVSRDVVLWNSMLAAYAQNGHPEDALTLCSEMAFASQRPTVATLVIVISASADIGALPQGREIHGFSWRQGFAFQDKVKTALVDMYAKCGSVRVARRVFERLQEKRVVAWNAMVSGYAMHGCYDDAIDLFEEMIRQGYVPDHITFVGVLSACRHGRLLDEGWRYFNQMIEEYHINPTVQHYTCMVDLLGHTGRLKEAHDLIMEMKVTPDSAVWGSLLNACKIHGNVELGELALEKIIELQPNDSGNYVILSNIYAQSGQWDGVARVRRLMIDKGVKKNIACSWIELKNEVHAFLSGDTTHPMCDTIYAELERVTGLVMEAGYAPTTGTVFHDVEDDEKTGMVCSHSERLAIAFGLISTQPGTRLHITKNLRACEDCHIFIKFVSKVTQREIIIRDVNRYHHFKDGECSCGDHW
ncbi:pentatricopeptide repeat-containing protein At3g46790, chloroplastic-like [Chenopodium quinoa]|nr:pentatricopeptide repeat-containing protein At3g46790, chloroplastic-like [Chenopodium quinoa]XP_021763467.1 pentatricopeptide repeat-containing protein At3g46790, chloroplastic-like [Chenopodium quinoa]XP_021763468.1 pentatricopeptide repeat-containing protein At3g46790, chloroplastic-like [Chenopodium quinoa]